MDTQITLAPGLTILLASVDRDDFCPVCGQRILQGQLYAIKPGGREHVIHAAAGEGQIDESYLAALWHLLQKAAWDT